MIDNYDDKNINETLDAVGDFDDADKESFIRFEREHKDRSGVIDPLLDAVDLTDEEVFAKGNADVATEESDSGDDGLADEVTVVAERAGYVGGMWFDDAGNEARTETTTRVTDAIEDGELTIVNEHE